MTLLDVQKVKLQLFHCLQRHHRDAWKKYWGSFQLYMAAKISLNEFHAVTEELLGPNKQVHNELVMLLLSTMYDEVGTGERQRRLPLSLVRSSQDQNGEEERKEVASNGDYSMSSDDDSLVQIVKENDTQCDSEQLQQDSLDRKRSHRSISTNKNTEKTAAKKLMRLDRDKRLDCDHQDHQSAQLLMGLGKVATTMNPSSIVATPLSTSFNSSRGFEPRVSTANRRE